MKQELPLAVPPYSTVSLPFTLEVVKPGAFSASEPLYLDEGSLRVVTLSVQGEVSQQSMAGGP